MDDMAEVIEQLREVRTMREALDRIAAWDVGNGTYVCRLARVFA